MSNSGLLGWDILAGLDDLVASGSSGSDSCWWIIALHLLLWLLVTQMPSLVPLASVARIAAVAGLEATTCTLRTSCLYRCHFLILLIVPNTPRASILTLFLEALISGVASSRAAEIAAVRWHDPVGIFSVAGIVGYGLVEGMSLGDCNQN
jgi:hypothetical protein